MDAFVSHGSKPRTSVVIPAWRAEATLPVVLEALREQVEQADREVVVVDSSGSAGADALRSRFPWVRFEFPAERASCARARNIGIAMARGERIACLDADAIPEPGWLDELEDALEPDLDAVAGPVVNGTPRNAVGTADYLLEFSEVLPGPRGAERHAVTANLIVRREAVDRVGGFNADLWGGEDTILTFPIARAGKLGWAPSARVRHLNRTRLAGFLGHQRSLGSGFAEVCASVDYPHRWLARRSLAPLAAALRLLPLAGRLRRSPRQLALFVMLLPLLAAGLAAWAIGLASGPRR